MIDKFFNRGESMELTVTKRPGKNKSELTKIRFEGNIPGVMYARNEKSELVMIDGNEFRSVLRGMRKGYLPTTIFQLKTKKGTHKAIVKEIQYHPSTYQILHIDFQTLSEDHPVDINVPIDYVGEAECVGIKLGGFLRQVIRHAKVRCLPKDIPTDFKVNVKEMNIGHTKRIKDIDVGNQVRCLNKEEEVIVVIAKR